MCGIAGLYRSESPLDPSLLDHAARHLGHRGPDDHGTHVDGAFGMVHTRLSIIDPAGGHQPILSADGNRAVIANGEIYNYIELRRELENQGYIFRSHSDTEVILHLYDRDGEAALDHLRGMFAFALYDGPRKRLFLARDRLGIKPLFLSISSAGVAFASELKGLMPLLPASPRVSATGLVQYLHSQFNTGEDTILDGVERLLPGEAATVEAGRLARRWHYWSPLDIQTRAIGKADAEAEFTGLMDTVIEQHMRSDVPYGLFLSGGVDSGTLLGLLSRHSETSIRTFSVGFPGSSLKDELPLADIMAKRYATRHTAITPTPEELFGHLPLTVWAADDLMLDYANLPTSILAQRAGEELKVVFSGEGGDELFAGYRRYRVPRIERLLKSLLWPGSGGFRTSGTLKRDRREGLLNDRLRAAFRDVRRPFVNAWRSADASWSDLQRMQYVDVATALPDNLLVKLDRMLMAWAVEGRVPLLDHKVVEFALSLPDDLRVDRHRGKTFLKDWAAPLLGEEHLTGRKRGFHVPVGEWLSGDFLDGLETHLPRNPGITEWFQPEGVRTLIRRQRERKGNARLLWALVQFAIWHRLFIEGHGQRPDPKQHPLEVLAS